MDDKLIEGIAKLTASAPRFPDWYVMTSATWERIKEHPDVVSAQAENHPFMKLLGVKVSVVTTPEEVVRRYIALKEAGYKVLIVIGEP